MRSQLGFGFIELTIGIAILGIMAAALNRVAHYLSLSSASNAQNAVALHLMESVSETFGDNDIYCSKIIGGMALSPSQPNGVQMKSLDQYNLQGTKVGTLFTLGAEINHSGLIVSDFRVKPLYAMDAQNLVANLEITVQKSGASGPSASVYELPIYAFMNGGKVLTCSTAPQGQVVMNQRICDIWYDGYAYYDPVSKECQYFPNVIAVTAPPGITDKVACPAGYRLAASRFDPLAANCEISCFAESKGLGTQTRNYTNAAKPSGKLDIAGCKVDWSTNSCNWTWFETGDSSEIVMGARCLPIN